MSWKVPGLLDIDGRARDVRTSPTGDLDVGEVAEVFATVDGGSLVSLDVDPPAEVSGLLGERVASGFRAKVSSVLDASVGGPRALLIDDLPVAALIAGYATLRETSRAGSEGNAPVGGDGGGVARMADLCSGWRSGGTLLTALAAGGIPLQECPPAQPLVDPADPQGWHRAPAVAAGTMRRTRRIDATPRGDHLQVDAMFRDSYGEPEGSEVVLHEYQLDVVISGAGVIETIAAEPRVLPYDECPAAAASVALLVGVSLVEIEGAVKQRLSGVVGCTHLNDLLRSLRGLPPLPDRAPVGPSGAANT